MDKRRITHTTECQQGTAGCTCAPLCIAGVRMVERAYDEDGNEITFGHVASFEVTSEPRPKPARKCKRHKQWACRAPGCR